MLQGDRHTNSAPPVLVTGASGYLGGRLCEHLRTDGWAVAGLSRRPSGDLAGYDQLPDLLGRCRALVHCAAITEWFDHGGNILRVNADWPVELYQRCLDSGVEVMVFISSLSAAGWARGDECITEAGQWRRPLSDYARAKRLAERRLEAIQGETRLVILRTGLIYDAQRWPIGPGPVRLETPDQRLPLVHADNVCSAAHLSIANPAARGLFHVVDPEQPYTRQLCRRLGLEARPVGRVRRLTLPMLRGARAVFTGQRSWLRRSRHRTALARRRGTYAAGRLSRLGFTPAATLNSALPPAQPDPNQSCPDVPPMDAALVGAGRWARVLAPQLSATGRIRWRAVCDPYVSRGSLPRALRRLPLYTSVEAMLDGRHFDAAVLCTPNTLRAAQVAQLAPHVRALYVEKPLASSSRQLDQIATTADAVGAFVLAGHGLSSTSAAGRIAQLLAQAGTVLSARLVRTLSADYPCEDWRSDPRRCPGGVIAQLGLHLVDLAARLLGPVRIASVSTKPRARTGQIWSAGIAAQAGMVPVDMYCAFAQRDRLELIFRTPRGEIRATDSSISWTSGDAARTAPLDWNDAAAGLASRLHAAWWDLRAGVDAHSHAVAETFNSVLDKAGSIDRRATA